MKRLSATILFFCMCVNVFAIDGYLKQSTSKTIMIGPFLDNVDGITAETGLTIAQADVRLSKSDAVFAQKTEATSCTHDENGWYTCPLDTTDTATLGMLKIHVNESGAGPVTQTYMVVPALIYESWFGADKQQVHVVECTEGVIDAAAIATDAIGSDELAATATAEIADAVWDEDISAVVTADYAGTIMNAIFADTAAYDTDAEYATAIWGAAMENSKTYAEVMRVFAAVLSGKSSIATDEITFVGIDGTTERLVVTVASGARTSVDTWDGAE